MNLQETILLELRSEFQMYVYMDPKGLHVYIHGKLTFDFKNKE